MTSFIHVLPSNSPRHRRLSASIYRQRESEGSLKTQRRRYSGAKSPPWLRRPCWEMPVFSDDSDATDQEEEEEDDYAWYYQHPERYIRRPRRLRRGSDLHSKPVLVHERGAVFFSTPPSTSTSPSTLSTRSNLTLIPPAQTTTIRPQKPICHHIDAEGDTEGEVEVEGDGDGGAPSPASAWSERSDSLFSDIGSSGCSSISSSTSFSKTQWQDAGLDR